MTRILLRGGAVYAPTEPAATAMAVQDGTVVWVGDDAGAGSYADGADEVVELDGALVTPAFVDAHVHATSTGLALEGLDLSGATSLKAALNAVERHATKVRGRAIIGHGWDETRWPEQRPPTRSEVDRVSYGGVVYLSRIDVHSAVISSALAAAAPQMRSLPGWRDDGVISTEAHHLARTVVRAALAPEQRRAAQRAALQRAASLGIGCVHELAGPDISSAEDLREILELAAAEPGPQVEAYWGELGGVERARELGALGAAGDLFADGTIGSRSAALRSVYADADTTGHPYLSAAQVRDHVVACTEAGLQAGFHAIGDAAVDAVLAGYREAAAVVGADRIRAARHRLEHVEMVDDAGIATMAELGVVASVQPAFDRLWGGSDGMYAQRLGAARAATLNPFAAMARAGVTVALGSDSPVTPIDPWGTVRAAAWHHEPQQRLDVGTAFEAHTVGGWRAAGRDDAGTLTAGAPATYAVWLAGTGSPRTPAEATQLPGLEPNAPLPTCLRTVVRGRTVYAREGALS